MRDEPLVLHVDAPAVTRLARERLTAEEPSLRVVTAETAAEGLDVLDERPVECIVSDYALPDRDGLAFLAAVREHDPDLPFVLFTGQGSETVAGDAIAAGVTDYIQKRTGSEQYSLLANRVRNAVDGYRAERTADRRTRQQSVVADLGQRALDGVDLEPLFEMAVEAVADGLDVGHAALFERTGGSLRLRAGDGWPATDGGATAGSGVFERALDAGGPVVDTDLDRSLPGGIDAESCVCVPVRSGEEVWGVLGACAGDRRGFPEDDVTFVRSVANLLASELDRRDHVAELELKDKAFDAAPSGVVITDPTVPDDPIVYASDGFCEMTGYDEEEVLGRNCWFLRGPDTDPDAVAALRSAVGAGDPVTVELRNYRADGTEFWNRIEAAPVRTDGEVTAFVAFHQDVTDRRERERQLTRLHDATRRLVGADDAPEVAGIVVDAARDVLGFDVNGVRLLDGGQLVPAEMTDERKRVMGPAPAYDPGGDAPPAQALRTGETVLLEDLDGVVDDQRRQELGAAVYLPLGDHGTLSVGTAEPVEPTADDRQLLEILAANAGVALDRLNEQARVTEHEQQLQRERDKLVALFDNAVDPTVEYAYELPAGADGDPADDGEPIVHGVNEAFEAVFGYDEREAVGQHVDDLVVPPERQDRADEIDDMVRAGERMDVEVRRRTADGELRDFRFRNIPVPDAADSRGFAVYTDVTGRKAREQRLQVLNRVLRHNLRNDMNVVLGIAELVQRELDDPALAEEVESLQRVGERLLDRSSYARTIEETLAGSDDDREADVAALVAEEVAGLLERNPDADVRTDLPGAAVAQGGPSLRTAVRELLSNAVEHNGDEPSVEASVDTVTRDGQRYVRASVCDDGPGIPEHERQVLVAGAETPLQHGSGLGLWLVRWVVHAAGGWLDIEDRDSGGTCVTMYLPAAGE